METDRFISPGSSHQNLPVSVAAATEKDRMLSFLPKDSFLCFNAFLNRGSKCVPGKTHQTSTNLIL